MSDDDLFSGLFVCEDYVVKSYTFGDMKQSLLCSNMSSTDHDLTGQIVWPAAKLLSWFISTHKHLFKDKDVIELGAGTGLGGFVAAQLSRHTIITDGNEVVLRLIDRNINEGYVSRYDNDEKVSNDIQVVGRQLLWGQKNQIVDLVKEGVIPEVIIGADVVLWPTYTRALLLTVRWLLSFKPRSSRCYISYVCRAQTTTDLFLSNAEDLGLIVNDVCIGDFLPSVSDEERNESFIDPSQWTNMRIFSIELSPVRFPTSENDIDQCMFDNIPAEDEEWRCKAETINSPF